MLDEEIHEQEEEQFSLGTCDREESGASFVELIESPEESLNEVVGGLPLAASDGRQELLHVVLVCVEPVQHSQGFGILLEFGKASFGRALVFGLKYLLHLFLGGLESLFVFFGFLAEVLPPIKNFEGKL